MSDASRPSGRVFYLLPVLLAWVLMSSGDLIAQAPALTTVSDVVYRADGTPAGGALLISWPAFTTADGHTIAAGNNTAVLGAGGALSIRLVPNAGAVPSGTFYTVVYQLDDGTVKTEYWAVTTMSPATIAEVRTTPGTVGQPSELATEQFVNTALAGKANDSAVVHLNGDETITGAKQFAVAPHRVAFVLGFVESGLPPCPPEKKARKLTCKFGGTFSLVRIEGESRVIAAISSDSQRNAAGFLCIPDCLAVQAVPRHFSAWNPCRTGKNTGADHKFGSRCLAIQRFICCV